MVCPLEAQRALPATLPHQQEHSLPAELPQVNYQGGRLGRNFLGASDFSLQNSPSVTLSSSPRPAKEKIHTTASPHKAHSPLPSVNFALIPLSQKQRTTHLQLPLSSIEWNWKCHYRKPDRSTLLQELFSLRGSSPNMWGRPQHRARHLAPQGRADSQIRAAILAKPELRDPSCLVKQASCPRSNKQQFSSFRDTRCVVPMLPGGCYKTFVQDKQTAIRGMWENKISLKIKLGHLRYIPKQQLKKLPQSG